MQILAGVFTPSAGAYESIATTVITSDTASVTFSSIPQTYTDLVLVLSTGVTTGSSINIFFRYNNDSSALYSRTTLYGDGSSAGSSRGSGATEAYAGQSETTIQSMSTVQIFNYSNTTTFKTCITRDSQASLVSQSRVNLYRSTSAISRLDVHTASSTFIVGSTFTLYGIKAA